MVGKMNKVTQVAKNLRDSVFNAFDNREPDAWPPDFKSLKCGDVVPADIVSFLSILISGKEAPVSTKNKRLIDSLGQDICRAVTNAEWKLLKHILLCMTLRHLFRSKELITLINRFGHCENHSYSLELETAMAKAVEESSSMLSNQIICHPSGPSVFHSEFDNFDQFVNDLSGKGSVHTAHGIMLQEVTINEVPNPTETQQIPKDKKRSLVNVVADQLDECYISQRKSPEMSIQRNSTPGSEAANLTANQKDIAWLVLRSVKSDNQTIPGWAGFVSQTGEKPDRLTLIDYYPVIYHPITEYSTVKECLHFAERATHEVGQKFVYSTFDLGVCMKAFPLIWNNPQRFDNHIVLIGTFHLSMGYMNMIGKKMDGSGFTDILLEANMISSGSLQGVLSGKNYNRAVRCHKVLLESLHRLLMSEFSRGKGHSSIMDCFTKESQEKFEEVRKNLSKDGLESLISDGQVNMQIEEYISFCENVRNGCLGKTGQFWANYMDHVSMVLKLMRAVKTNDFE